MTDTVLILDFGSQVTQLIARRVREAGVYSEIAPVQQGGRGDRPAEAEGGDLLRRTGERARQGRAAAGALRL